MSDDNVFIDGLYVKKPVENAPPYVIAKGSITRKELGNWLRNQKDDYIDFDILESKGGKYYVKIDTWKPDPQQRQQLKNAAQGQQSMGDAVAQTPDFDDDIPF